MKNYRTSTSKVTTRNTESFLWSPGLRNLLIKKDPHLRIKKLDTNLGEKAVIKNE